MGTTSGRVVSVNVGRERPIAAKGGTSGIDKRPVDGPVAVSAPGPKGLGGSGLAGDHVSDTAHHGGDDQAVHAYAREDLDAWEAQLGRPLRCGVFGENLTTAGVDVTGAVIGETWAVGTALLQVSCPRIPCVTFAVWLGEERWVPRFTAARVPGAYLRVLRAGEVRAGDAVRVLEVPAHGVDVRTAFAALTTSPELLPLLAGVPQFPVEDREAVSRRLARERAGGGAGGR
ncbi:MOSC domain-containing protein [Kineococcus indalonis]|uniref:MOSC domain-containing protein n=1 Tax=Kineococcus indalonis TaxID=2696566 RepID=UPI001411F429|nr:MOSC domain-containing protein [Kineococcus indalonis]NAZ86935.1 MOSC domain-containing protein [Kineococcus indalonis]